MNLIRRGISRIRQSIRAGIDAGMSIAEYAAAAFPAGSIPLC